MAGRGVGTASSGVNAGARADVADVPRLPDVPGPEHCGPAWLPIRECRPVRSSNAAPDSIRETVIKKNTTGSTGFEDFNHREIPFNSLLNNENHSKAITTKRTDRIIAFERDSIFLSIFNTLLPTVDWSIVPGKLYYLHFRSETVL